MFSKLFLPRFSTLITLALILAGYGLFMLNTWHDQKQVQQQELRHLSNMLKQNANAVFNHHGALLRTVGHYLHDLQNHEQLLLQGRSYLNKVQALNPGMAGFGYAQLDGQLLLVSNIDDQSSLPNLMSNPASADGFKDVLGGKRLTLGRPYHMPLLGQWLMPVRVPVEDDQGRIRSVMTAGYKMGSADSDWQQLTQGSDSQLAMIREEGRWQLRLPLATAEFAEQYSGQVPDTLMHIVRKWGDNGLGAVSWDGQAYMVASRHLPEFGLYAISFTPYTSLVNNYIHALLPSLPLLLAVLICWWAAVLLMRRTEHERARAEQQARQLAGVVDQNTHALAIIGPDGQLEYRNPNFSERFPDVTKLTQLWPTAEGREWSSRIKKALQHQKSFSHECLLNLDKRWYQLRVTPLADKQAEPRQVLALEDINERKHAELQLYHQVHYDLLTGLPNRSHALELLQDALEEAQQQEHGVLVCYLDLDEFKQLNDYYGHRFADGVLKRLALYLAHQLGDQGRACHMSADEFLVFLPYRDDKACKRLVQRLQNLLRFELEVEGHQLACCLSGGYSQYEQGEYEASQLISYADLALRQAKQQGAASLVAYTPEMSQQLTRNHQMQNALERALARESLSVNYQGKFSAQRGQIVGVEALVRWHDEAFGWVSPAEFIPLAEEHGLIEKLGRFVLNQACADLCELRRSSGLPLTVAVNISVRQLRPALVQEIDEALRRHNLPGSALEIELTESLWAQNFTATHQLFERILKLGVRLSIDDFGTGYSSLSYLSRFPVHCLKIDRSFVSDMDTSSNDRNVVAGIIALGHSLSLDVVAEGVETDAQRSLLSEMGCDQLQGFLLSRPQPLQELLETF